MILARIAGSQKGGTFRKMHFQKKNALVFTAKIYDHGIILLKNNVLSFEIIHDVILTMSKILTVVSVALFVVHPVSKT